MEAAKAAVSKFTSNTGHKTSVDEVVNPAVTQETIKPHRHEEVTQAVDREVHQHHYHTTVQPVNHQETLPEKHAHNMLPTEHKEFRHENDQDTKARVQTEHARFKPTQTIHETRHTQEAAATVSGERVHHHVHETVVPVISKETIQPEVVHTTVPVHETHHVASQHHGLSALPMKSLGEFKQAGGILGGSKSTAREEYDGQPRPYNDKLNTTFDKLGFGHGSSTSGTTGTTGHRNTDSGIGMDSPTGRSSGVTGSSGLGRESGISGREHGISGHEHGISGREQGISGGNSTGLGRESGMGGTDGAMRGNTTGTSGVNNPANQRI